LKQGGKKLKTDRRAGLMVGPAFLLDCASRAYEPADSSRSHFRDTRRSSPRPSPMIATGRDELGQAPGQLACSGISPEGTVETMPSNEEVGAAGFEPAKALAIRFTVGTGSAENTAKQGISEDQQSTASATASAQSQNGPSADLLTGWLDACPVVLPPAIRAGIAAMIEAAGKVDP
jgi:hypothetical protein